MNKANPIKPTTKESYAMPKAQTHSSNHFEVLGKIPNLYDSTSSNPIYKSKQERQLIQILEVDHISASGTFDLQNFFQQDNFFLFQNPADSMNLFSWIVNLSKFHISKP